MKHEETPWYLSKHNIITAIFIGFALFYLLTEHRAHFFSALPWLILLLCPLMHIFMHHGHGGHDHSDHKEDK